MHDDLRNMVRSYEPDDELGVRTIRANPPPYGDSRSCASLTDIGIFINAFTAGCP